MKQTLKLFIFVYKKLARNEKFRMKQNFHQNINIFKQKHDMSLALFT